MKKPQTSLILKEQNSKKKDQILCLVTVTKWGNPSVKEDFQIAPPPNQTLTHIHTLSSKKAVPRKIQ